MKLLIVAATKAEIEPLLGSFPPGGDTIQAGDGELTVLITGVGMVATAYNLGKLLATKNYDLAINAGICGSFDRSIAIGELVLVEEDHFAELGAENGREFLPIDKMGLAESTMIPISTPLNEKPDIALLKKVKGITVNTVHGDLNSINTIVERLDPGIESMEGAAFFFACNEARLPSIQLRSVSNYVELRNHDTWNIPLSVKNLNSFLIGLFNL
jgi:futalosine hydrolase